MSEWIKIDDKAPKQDQVCLVFANDIVSSWVDIASYYKCPEYGFIIWEKDGDDYPPIVTHWMPLPEPPKD